MPRSGPSLTPKISGRNQAELAGFGAGGASLDCGEGTNICQTPTICQALYIHSPISSAQQGGEVAILMFRWGG